MLLGCFLLGAATLAGLVFVHRPWPNRVDAIGLRLLPADLSSRWAADVAHLGSLTVLIAGSAVLCVVAAISRNRMRALSCLIAPIAAVLIVQSVAKPLVGRHFEGTSALSYPSGTVAAVAALAAAAFLVVPRFAKPLVAVAGGAVVVAVCAAVVVLRWHYPTDAARRCVRRSGCRVCTRWSSVVDPQPSSRSACAADATDRRRSCARRVVVEVGRPHDAGDHRLFRGSGPSVSRRCVPIIRLTSRGRPAPNIGLMRPFGTRQRPYRPTRFRGARRRSGRRRYRRTVRGAAPGLLGHRSRRPCRFDRCSGRSRSPVS